MSWDCNFGKVCFMKAKLFLLMFAILGILIGQDILTDEDYRLVDETVYQTNGISSDGLFMTFEYNDSLSRDVGEVFAKTNILPKPKPKTNEAVKPTEEVKPKTGNKEEKEEKEEISEEEVKKQETEEESENVSVPNLDDETLLEDKPENKEAPKDEFQSDFEAEGEGDDEVLSEDKKDEANKEELISEEKEESKKAQTEESFDENNDGEIEKSENINNETMEEEDTSEELNEESGVENIDTERDLDISQVPIQDVVDSLLLTENDVIFQYVDSNFFDMIIRKKTFINSVMLMNEPTKDHPEIFAFRATNRSLPFMESEARIVDGELVKNKSTFYHLVDSTVEYDVDFTNAFRLRVPLYCFFGTNTLSGGVMRMENGRNVILRAFALSNASYLSHYADNHFTINVAPKPKPVLKVESRGSEDGYMIVNLYYSDYETDKITFKISDSLFENSVYRDLPIKQGNEVADKIAILTEITRSDKERGKRVIRLRLYIKNIEKERILSVNSFSQNGDARSNPINIRFVAKQTD